jgi:hypothetical protein
MVTHDNRILDVADRIIQMEDGCLISDEATWMIRCFNSGLLQDTGVEWHWNQKLG